MNSCVVFNHFEKVAATLDSIKRALRPGGRFIVVDIERIPGVSSENTLKHVRAGKQTVIEKVKTPRLNPNYYLMFGRP